MIHLLLKGKHFQEFQEYVDLQDTWREAPVALQELKSLLPIKKNRRIENPAHFSNRENKYNKSATDKHLYLTFEYIPLNVSSSH